jgi:hypothetical protein
VAGVPVVLEGLGCRLLRGQRSFRGRAVLGALVIVVGCVAHARNIRLFGARTEPAGGQAIKRF